MEINFEHKNDIGIFIKDNIENINNRISDFKDLSNYGVDFDDTDIKRHLSEKLNSESQETIEALIKRFEELGAQKNQIVTVSNEYVLYKKDVERLIESDTFRQLQMENSEELQNAIVSTILDNSELVETKKKFIKRALKNITRKSLYLLLQNGFQVNINHLESGTMTANGGDSAQFLFVSRAILAGFNCSNVDVRSSRYDSVIDYKGHIFKVQVKGISSDTISFKDRDRGGRGIDTHNERNRGKRITSQDCDLYVAVDKLVGLCYLIPMKEIDPWSDEEIKSVSVSKLGEYLENWDVIERLYQVF